MADSILNIKFKDVSFRVSPLYIYDEKHLLKKEQTDSAVIFIEYGEEIESKRIYITSNALTNFRIEQRYQTSVTIMDEGPHCDLTDWKHFYSDWKTIAVNDQGSFIADSYSEKENEQFPQTDINEFKEAVKKHCGDGWYKYIKDVKSLNNYPIGVGINRIIFKVTATRKDDGSEVSKILIFENALGC